MNDPNGLVYHDGRYHLFFQYNPLGVDHANLSWGHASSPDLVDWEHHRVAIPFDDDEEIFSGSVVVDRGGASGFAEAGEPVLVALYTSMSKTQPRQSQSVAYSVDGGTTWTKYAGNPVLDRASSDFRDPKVIRWEGCGESYWVMIAVEAIDRQVVFYRSDDLLNWEFLSVFGPLGAVGGEWECPDLFPLRVDGTGETRWVLLVSLNPGGIAGGSGTQYFLGDFDGRSFAPAGEAAPSGWLDYGRDCYAGITFAGLHDDERTLIAWMNNWDYARVMPTDPVAPQRGRMTMARRLSLVGGDGAVRLRQTPVGPPVIRAARVTGLDLAAGEEWSVDLPAAGRIDLAVAPGDSAGFVVDLLGRADARVRLAYDAAAGEFTVDRRESARGFPAAFASIERMPVAAAPEVVLSIWFDEHAVEIYAEDGTRVLTDLVGTLRADSLRLTGLGGDIRIVELTAGAASCMVCN